MFDDIIRKGQFTRSLSEVCSSGYVIEMGRHSTCQGQFSFGEGRNLDCARREKDLSFACSPRADCISIAGALAFKRAKRSTMGKKIWLSMHARISLRNRTETLATQASVG